MKALNLICILTCLCLCLCLIGGCSSRTELTSVVESKTTTTASEHTGAATEKGVSTTSTTTSTVKTETPIKTTKKTQTRLPATSPTTQKAQKATQSTNANSGKQYGLNESWVVDDQWELTFTAVERHNFCNSFSDGNGYSDCIVFTYSYKNIGYTGDIQDLFISSLDLDVYDESGEAADRYPCTHTRSPKVCSVGTKCTAQQAYKLKTSGKYITIVVNKYTSNNTGKQRATFKLNISGGSNTAPVSDETFPSDVKTYADFPYAPDYGATIGIDYDMHTTNTYAYSIDKVMEADPNAKSLANYMYLLQRCGYSLTSDIYLKGEKFTAFVNTKFGRTIAFRNDTKLGYVLILVK